MTWKNWTLIGLATAALALPGLPASLANHDPSQDHCSLDEVDWGEFAYDTQTPLGTRLERTVGLVDTQRLNCGPDVYRDAIREIAFHFIENPCAAVDLSGLHPNDANAADGLVEVNWQAENGNIFDQVNHLQNVPLPLGAGESHLYLSDGTCGFETILLLAANPTTTTVVIGIGAESGSPDRSVLTAIGFKTPEHMFGANAHTQATIPACDLVKVLGDPVDPSWGPGTPFGPSSADAGSPWATAPYGATPNFPQLNTDGNCLVGDWESVLSLADVLADVQAVPGVADLPSLGTIDRYRVADPLGGSTVVFCAVLQVGTAKADPCASIGSRVNTAFTVIGPDAPVPVPTATVTFSLCDADLSLMMFGAGIERRPIVTPCYE